MGMEVSASYKTITAEYVDVISDIRLLNDTKAICSVVVH